MSGELGPGQDSLVNSLSDSDPCMLLPQQLEGDAKIGPSSCRSATEGATVHAGCSAFQQAEIARRIKESTEAQDAFSSAVAFRASANIATALSPQNVYRPLVS
jgi:hypothetical protein